MAKWCLASLLLCIALTQAVAARHMPGSGSHDSAAATTALPATAKNTGAGAGIADKKNIFVGAGGMGDLPGFPAVGVGYGGGFGNNGGGVFSGVTGPLGGVGVGVGSLGPLGGITGFGPIGGLGGGGSGPLGGFGGGPFGGLGGGGGGVTSP